MAANVSDFQYAVRRADTALMEAASYTAEEKKWRKLSSKQGRRQLD